MQQGTIARCLRIVAPLVLGLAVLVPSAVRAGTPSAPLPPASDSGLAANHDGEPNIAAASDGTLWATAFTLGDPKGSGQDIWKSTDDGAHWAWVANPFRVPGHGVTLGGDDADIAVATQRNPLGAYNVYAASLWVTTSVRGLLVGDISLAVSPDSGKTWVLHPLAGQFPGDDRPWVAADGPCRVYLNYHAGPTLANVVNVYDLCDPVATIAGLTLTPIASTRYPSLATSALTDSPATYVTAGFGKLVVDTSAGSAGHHDIYIPMMDCPNLTLQQEVARAEAADATCPAGTRAEVYVLVGTPAVGPGAFGWRLADLGPSTNSQVPVWPSTAAVDSAGRVFVSWHDAHSAYLQASADQGRTWTSPVAVPSGGEAAVYPTVAATGDGQVVVAFYGADRAGDANDEAIMGAPGGSSSAVWALEAVTAQYEPGPGGFVFGPVESLDPLVHRGMLCTNGDACTVGGSRDLFDNFGAVTSPTSGRTSIVYTSDNGGGIAADTAKSGTIAP